MNAAGWRTVLQVYEAAAELPSDQRRSFVESATTAPEVAAEALALLEGIEGGDEPDSSTPAKIGRYEVLEPLGRGGMGRVVEAFDVQLGEGLGRSSSMGPVLPW
jgi:hypothetical protein